MISNPAVTTRDVNFFYGTHQALLDVSLDFPRNTVSALIGPSGCGKSTYLRCISRMNDRIPSTRMDGTILVEGENIYARRTNLVQLRRKVGMIFQRAAPFPGSIYDNIAMAPRLHYGLSKPDLEDLVEEALTKAVLWDEVKDSLKKSALALSGGQQQRLCIARTLAVQPHIILMDEPCSALDPISTAKIEELIHELAKDYTLIVVTHNLHQAARVSAYTAFFLNGRVIEHAKTDEIFQRPAVAETEDYVRGRFG